MKPMALLPILSAHTVSKLRYAQSHGFTIPAFLLKMLEQADPQKIRIGERAWNKTFDELSERTKMR